MGSQAVHPDASCHSTAINIFNENSVRKDGTLP